MKYIKLDTKLFDVGDGFYIEVSKDIFNNSFSAYIFHKDYGVKSLVYGMEDEAALIECIERRSGIDEAIEQYSNGYMR
jgi:hypothetical protein